MKNVLFLALLLAAPVWVQDSYPTTPVRRPLRTRRQVPRNFTPPRMSPGSRTLDSSDARSQRINRIGQSLAAQAGRPVAWRFVLVNKPEPNAACAGEGIVYVNVGLLDLGLTDDELAGILGHEIAHGARQHLAAPKLESARIDKTINEYDEAKAQWERAQAEYAQESARTSSSDSGDPPTQGISMAESRLDFARHVYEMKMRGVKQRVDQHKSYKKFEPVFSQQQEREADAIGTRYAVAAGYSSDGLLHALTKLMRNNYSKYGRSALQGGKTHPPIAQRIQLLASWTPSDGSARPASLLEETLVVRVFDSDVLDGQTAAGQTLELFVADHVAQKLRAAGGLPAGTSVRIQYRPDSRGRLVLVQATRL